MLFCGGMDTKPVKGRHERRPNFYRYRLLDNENMENVLVALATFPSMGTEAFYDLSPHLSEAKIRHRLRCLHSDGYIDHVKSGSGSDMGIQNVHAISAIGYEYLEQQGLLPEPLVKGPGRRVKGAEPLYPTVHQSMIVNLICSLKGANNQVLTRRELIGEASLQLPYKFTYKGETHSGTIRPDQYVKIPENEYYFVEAQYRSPNEPTDDLDRSSFLQKVYAYADILGVSKKYKDQLGIGKARVLVTTLTEAKRDNLMDIVAAQEASFPSISTLFYFQVTPRNGKFPDLYNTPWLRAGLPPVRLDGVQ